MSSPLTLPFSSKPITHGKFRLERYSSSIGNPAQTASGSLTWNDNGSPKQLVISDQFNAPNSQTCNYAHDDLSRISNVNCGTAWQQAFGFDVFGNISKTGSLSFTPTYAAATNRISGGGYPASYDNNGNLTNDGLGKTFAWNADNNPRTVSNGSVSITVIYDALGRAVENQNGSSYTEIVYGPDGSKLALMNGTTLVKAFVPLPGGGQAVYTASGLAYYRHADWLGNSRLASTPSRALYFSGAYAPYGEDYAKTGTTDLSFTGQNQDTMSGLYDFMYRRYNPVQGRWMSPDPAGLAVADPANPQTWNRYAYVSNDPMNLVDPLGLRPADFWWGDCFFYYVPAQNGDSWQQSSVCFHRWWDWDRREREPIPRDFWERFGKHKPPAATISSAPGFKKEFCTEQSNHAFWASIIPGYDVLSRGYRGSAIPGGLVVITAAEEIAKEVPDKSAGSDKFLTWVKQKSGFPKSAVGKWLSRFGWALTTVEFVDAVKNMQDEYKKCMEQ